MRKAEGSQDGMFAANRADTRECGLYLHAKDLLLILNPELD